MATLLEYNDHPPQPQPQPQPQPNGPGSVTTARLPVSLTTPAQHFPRHIVFDDRLCVSIIESARAYVRSCTAAPGELVPVRHAAVNTTTKLVGEEAANVDLFAVVSDYITGFAQTADRLTAREIVVVPGREIVGGIQPNRVFIRQGRCRLIVELKSIAALEAHATTIIDMGRANGGRGTPIAYPQGGTGGAPAMVLNLGKHMVDRNCPWAILHNGLEFMCFNLVQRRANSEIYHHMVVSDRYPAWTSTDHSPGCLPLVSVAIGLLLGSQSIVNYTPPPTPIGELYLQSRRSETARMVAQAAQNQPSSSATRGATRGDRGRGRGPASRGRGRGHAHARGKALAKALDHAELAVLMYFDSAMEGREIPLVPIDYEKSERIAAGDTDDLPSTDLADMSTRLAHPFIAAHHSRPQARLYARDSCHPLGTGLYSQVFQGRCDPDSTGDLRPCALKVVYDFEGFPGELLAYEHLHKIQRSEGIQPPVPQFYGAFTGVLNTEPMGVLVMECLDKLYDSFDDWSDEEKDAAYDCAVQLHRAGLHHNDLAPRNFGRRANGELVVFDFSNASLIRDPCGCTNFTVDKCYDINDLKKQLQGLVTR